MRTYAIKQKIMTLGDDFSIRDEAGDEVFKVHGKLFSFGADLSLRDTEGVELIRIRQRLMTIAPTYRITRAGAVIATVKKKLFTMRPSFDIDFGAGGKILVIGNFIYYDYTFYRGETVVAQVSKKIIAFSDSYGVQIEDTEDNLLILAATVVVDMVLHGSKKKKKE